MDRKIEINICEEEYIDLVKRAQKIDLSLEEYIHHCLMSSYDLLLRNNEKIKEMIAKGAESLIDQIDKKNFLKKDNSTKEVKVKKKGLVLLSLEKLDKILLKKLENQIRFYRDKSWFKQQHFYCIIDGVKIVGYIGVSICDEMMPYSKYAYIYAFFLGDKYKTVENIQYVFRFIERIAKKEQCFSIDIIQEKTNISDKLLKSVGFTLFSTSLLVKNIKTDGENTVNYEIKDIKNFSSEIIEEFLPIGRDRPILFLLDEWEIDKKHIDFYQCNIFEDKSKIEVMIVREDYYISDNKYQFFTLFLSPTTLYDDVALQKVYKMFNEILIKKEEWRKNLLLYIPKEGQSLIHHEKIKEICWYRKVI